MSETRPFQRGMFFEDFEVGQRIITPSRTITESDIGNFAGLSGDFNAIHTDAVFAESTPYGRRIAHGLLGLSVISGLAERTGFIEGTILAFREIKDWKFSLPVFIGDTIHADIEIEEIKALPRLGGGSIIFFFNVKNQKGETVMKGHWSLLVRGRPQD